MRGLVIRLLMLLAHWPTHATVLYTRHAISTPAAQLEAQQCCGMCCICQPFAVVRVFRLHTSIIRCKSVITAPTVSAAIAQAAPWSCRTQQCWKGVG